MHHPARKTVIIIAAAALVLSALPAMAVDPEKPTDEDKAKLLELKKFVDNRDAFFSTVNLIDKSTLPVTFPFVDVAKSTRRSKSPWATASPCRSCSTRVPARP
jgi:hypothetical protein